MNFTFSPLHGEKVPEGRMRGGAAFEDERAPASRRQLLEKTTSQPRRRPSLSCQTFLPV